MNKTCQTCEYWSSGAIRETDKGPKAKCMCIWGSEFTYYTLESATCKDWKADFTVWLNTPRPEYIKQVRGTLERFREILLNR